ncbi:MAG: 2-succinyl-6-hydroxy-2,4-cyclohexadiene-1-carboxylate synthase [Roseiflexus sp.]|nr:2-succinyl-6-hydroxy-2,4-cyclohexadiene-1-carboxylate synthase [Roseiflexus sp.]
MRSPVDTSTRIAYHYLDTGDGAPLVLLHGFTGSSASWDEVVPHVAQRFRVIRIDLPGHGRTPAPSDPARGALPLVAADIAALLRDLKATPAHLLGYSMGARLALGIAVLHPYAVRSLILESGSPGLATEAERAARRAQDEALAARIEQHGIEAFVDEWERLPLWASQRQLPPDVRQRLRMQRLRNMPAGLAASLRSIGTGAQPSFWDDLPHLTIPTLAITGALDEKFTIIAREMCARCPTMTHQIIEGAGHAPHLERPAEFAERVLEFISHWGPD